MTTLTVHPQTQEQLSSIKAFMKALKIKFEIMDDSTSPYNTEFVAMVKQSDMEFESGQSTKISLDEFKDLCK